MCFIKKHYGVVTYGIADIKEGEGGEESGFTFLLQLRNTAKIPRIEISETGIEGNTGKYKMEKDEVWRKTYADVRFLLPALPYEAVQRPQAGIFSSPKENNMFV